MNKKAYSVFCVILTALVAMSAFAVDDEIVTRYLTAANDQYSNGNYAKAFSYVNNVLSSYKEETIPQNVDTLAEVVYYSYLNQIKEAKDTAAFDTVKEKLLEFPYISSDRINRIVKIINTYEAQDVAWGADPTKPAATTVESSSSNSNPVLRNTLELQLALEKVKNEAAAKATDETQKVNDAYQQKLLETQKDAYESALSQLTSNANANTNAKTTESTILTDKVFFLAIIALAGIMVILFIIVIINLVLNLNTSKKQNEKFVETLKVVSELVRMPAPGATAPALPPTFNMDGEVRLIGSMVKDTGLPSGPTTDTEKKELSDLAVKCREIGTQIDTVTGRKNNSKNVSEMIFKIAQEMGISQTDATLLFSVGMVYDIGFLEIDPKLLQGNQLTDAQKYEIRNHVKQGLAQISFVPEKYLSVFADGIQMHHENMDGSGYPEGLQGARIPFIARLIHVTESFTALVSRRNYRSIYDKESAIDELRKKPGMYDPEIVDVLEKII